MNRIFRVKCGRFDDILCLGLSEEAIKKIKRLQKKLVPQPDLGNWNLNRDRYDAEWKSQEKIRDRIIKIINGENDPLEFVEV